eukprot:SAG25_NODE_4476_length_807_cov_0.864407_1_plen_71_part_10
MLLLLGTAAALTARSCDPGLTWAPYDGANATWMATTVMFTEMSPGPMDVFLSTTVFTGCAGGYIGAQIHQG